MSGRTSGKTKVAQAAGPEGQEQAQGGGGTLASGHDPPEQSSKSPAQDYSSVSVTTLRTALRKRQLSTEGVKKDLIARLQKSDDDNKLAAATAHSGWAQDNAILRLHAASIPADPVTENTTEDSVMSQDPTGVQVAATTAGEEDNSPVIDVLGVSGAPDEDGAAAFAHSEVTVDGTTEVADAGETLLPQQLTYSAEAQLPPLDLAGQHGGAACAHSEVTVDGTSEVADTGENLLPQHVTYSAEVQFPPLEALPPASTSSIKVATPTTSPRSSDCENLRTELRTRDDELRSEWRARDARFEDMLKALTVSHANVDTRLKSVETQSLAVDEGLRRSRRSGRQHNGRRSTRNGK
jgi:hypothetical protein